MTASKGKVVDASHAGEAVRFFVVNPKDHIQSHHLRGEFYELEELAIIARHFKRGGVFLDVGANVGNHAVYLAKFLGPGQVIVIEPNPPAIEVLRQNITLNQLDGFFDLSHVGFALSDEEGVVAARSPRNNLGGTRLAAPSIFTKLFGKPDLPTVTADALFAGRHIDFIKMDVEGMELKALNGMRKLIAASRPVMFVEVDNKNADGFAAFVADAGYVVKERFKRYPVNENFLIVPAEKG